MNRVVKLVLKGIRKLIVVLLLFVNCLVLRGVMCVVAVPLVNNVRLVGLLWLRFLLLMGKLVL